MLKYPDQEESLITKLDKCFVLVGQIFDEWMSICDAGQAVNHEVEQVRLNHKIGNIVIRSVC